MEPRPEPQLKQRLEQHLKELPSLPTVVAQLMTLDREAEGYFEQLLAVLETDPNLSARVLASANSATSGSRAEIRSLRAALARIGSQATSNLVLSMAVTSVFIPRDAWEKSLWRHAIQVANAARELAARCSDADIDPDEAYACGLLHDIGRFILFQEAPEELRRIDEGDWHDPQGLLELERDICGLTHSELGALVCRRWGIPEAIAEMIQNHHVVGDARIERLTALIQVADIAMFPSAMPGTPGVEEADDATLRDTVHARFPPFLRITLDELRGLLRDVAQRSQAAVESLGIA